MSDVDRPRLEGTVEVRGGRRLGFAAFGPAHGQSVVWLHGTPGGRRQIPLEARAYADRHGLRIIGIDRPGIGSSTPWVYDNILDFVPDLEIVADVLGLGAMHVIGLSGGGPYALAAGVGMADRVKSVAVIGGVAPTVGVDAIAGGAVGFAERFRGVIEVGRVPIGFALTAAIRVVKPLAGRGLDLYAVMQPEGDKRLLGRPEFKAMFLDDLLNGSRWQITAPLSDLLLFTRHWGFEVSEVKVPVRWYHGDADHIVPFAHGLHVSGRIPDSTMVTMEGESHLGGLGLAEEILDGLLSATKKRRPVRAVPASK
jgi:pimeloyl-ACP methyl ester carboxylesterase